MLPMIVRCPAKVNLFLSVGPVDARNYHPLRSVFQAVGLFDELHIEAGPRGHAVTFDDPSIPEENTVTRTLRLLAEIVDVPPLRVHVVKRIPMESGLGGGSSDAAGIIRVAKKIGRAPIPAGELGSVALAVGADVPFFLVGGRAKAEGYGEILSPLPDEPVRWIVIAKPAEGSSTRSAFQKLDAISYPWRGFPENDLLYNDFERVARPESLGLIERLRDLGAIDAGLTGSGSAVFGRFDSQEEAERSSDSLRAEGVSFVTVAPTLSRKESLAV